jgi:hypothetical protein
MYLDSVEETLSYYDSVSEPHDYVKYTPKLFNMWLEWARNYKPREEDQLRPFGVHIGPDWMKSEFENINAFYEFYASLLND